MLFLATVLAGGVAQERPQRKLPAPDSDLAQAPEATERVEDVRAIRALLNSFVKAYNEGNAEALGALFTQDAEIEDEQGAITTGREAIVARFEVLFQEKEGGILEVEPSSLRFLGKDLAIEDGTALTSTGSDGSVHSDRYSVIYARQDGTWLHARIRDEPPELISPHERLEELDWILGEWINESDDALVSTTGKWSDDGNFLLREFDVKVEGSIALTGTQRIGWDGQRKQFRTWVFDDEGGFAEGLMARDGDQWVIKSTGVRSNGDAVSVTTRITVLGPDRVLWESADRTVGGEAVPDSDSFYLVRQPPSPQESDIPAQKQTTGTGTGVNQEEQGHDKPTR
jgi:uncharacterized protein (TIGR02246 family)